MIKVYKENEFVNWCSSMEIATKFIKDNNYQIYTIYCGGKDIIVIEVV